MKVLIFDGVTSALMPESSLLLKNMPVFLPECAQAFVAMPVLVWRVCRLGKCVPRRFVHRYRDQAAMSVVTLVRGDTLGQGNALRTGFDGALATGAWLPMDEWLATAKHEVTLLLNGTPQAKVDACDLAEVLDDRLAETSRYMTIKTGDMIGVTLPASVPVSVDDIVEATTPDRTLLRVRYK